MKRKSIIQIFINIKTYIINRVLNIVDWLKYFLFDKDKYNTKDIMLESLSPTDKADKNNVYCSAIKNSLDNESNFNIGITGGYGSGKSSIIKSFEKKYCSNYNFIHISLAKFNSAEENSNSKNNIGIPVINDVQLTINSDNNEIEVNSKSNNTCTEFDINQSIEQSILQQIFYHENSRKVPDSRFIRIKRLSYRRNFTYSILLTIWVLSFGRLLFVDFLRNLTNWHYITQIDSLTLENISFYFALSIFLVGMFYIISKVLRILNRTQLTKLNFKDGEIELDKTHEQSILNRYIDEIIYFFEVTKYDVVILEDLDRLGNVAIFNKLREINLLLNESNHIKRKISFIYAMRDDLFEDDSRTKFFDIIIPIIPILSISNSEGEFNKLKRELKLDGLIDKELISEVSLHITNMRLLKNIFNEFIIYKENLHPELSKSKLFALIVYKNIFPKDFNELSFDRGNLFNLFNEGKVHIIESKKAELESDILDDKKSLKKFEKIYLKNEAEIKTVYINHIIDYILDPEKGRPTINGISITLEYINDHKNELIELIKENGFSYRNTDQTIKKVSFSEIEKDYDPEIMFDERVSEIKKKYDADIKYLTEKIEKTNLEKAQLTILPLYRLFDISEYSFEEFIITVVDQSDIEIKKNETKKKIVEFLIKNNYINEDYLLYISHFSEDGGISLNEFKFILSIKNHTIFDRLYNLKNVDNVLKKISVNEFSQPEILNVSLIDFILSNSTDNDVKIDLLFKQLSNESISSINFIELYSQKGLKISKLIELLTKYWMNFWHYINNVSGFDVEVKNKYLAAILNYGTLSDIIAQNSENELSTYISNCIGFLKLVKNFNPKAIEIIKKFPIRFNILSHRDNNIELFDFIFNNGYYLINIENIKIIIECKGININDLEQNLATSNYSTIIASGCVPLILKIESDIVNYVDNVLLKIDTNKNEVEASLVDLLLNNEISIENKTKIIETTETKIVDLSQIKIKEVCEVLANTNKFIPTWNNIFYYHKLFLIIDKYLSSYINSNYRVLSKEQKIVMRFPPEIIIPFYADLLDTSYLEDKAFIAVVDTFQYSFETIDFSRIIPDRLNYIISKGYILPTKSNFQYIKSKCSQSLINFVEKYNETYFTNITDYEFIPWLAIGILKSSKIKTSYKNKLVYIIQDLPNLYFFYTYNELATLLIRHILNQINSFSDIKINLLLYLAKASKDVESKVNMLIFLIVKHKIDNAKIISILDSFEKGTYSKLKKKKLDSYVMLNTLYNQKLLSLLQENGIIISFKTNGGYIDIITKEVKRKKPKK